MSSKGPTPEVSVGAVPESAGSPPTSKGIRFWLILLGLVMSAFVAVLEGYAVSTALPTIVSDLHANQFLWVASAYAITSTVLLPLIGGLSEIFGRRPVILSSLLLFMLGAAICGAAQNMNMLIAGRGKSHKTHAGLPLTLVTFWDLAIHGAGSGGIFSSYQIILSDLVTLEERGTYNGLFGFVWALGGGIGPLIGGALSHHRTWRWLFYLNIPVAGPVFVLLLFFLRLQSPQSRRTFWETVQCLDPVGNALVIGASCACAIALTWGGVQFSWSSAQVLVPLCIGVVGLCGWAIYEIHYSENPAVPFRILTNRTTWSGYLQIFLAAFVQINLIYYLPVYYQACKDASPVASGVDLLGLCFSTGVVSIAAGVSIKTSKKYRPQLWVAWCLVIIGMGLMSTVSADTRTGASIGFQVVVGVGIGIVYSGAYFPVLAPLPVTLNAAALAFFVFARSFAQIWGVTAGGVVLQNELLRRLPASVQNSAAGQNNIAYALIPLIPTMEQSTKETTQRAFAEALAIVWRMVIAFAGVGLLVSLWMKGLPLHTQRDEKWAMQKVESEPQRSTSGEVDAPSSDKEAA